MNHTEGLRVDTLKPNNLALLSNQPKTSTEITFIHPFCSRTWWQCVDILSGETSKSRSLGKFMKNYFVSVAGGMGKCLPETELQNRSQKQNKVEM